MKILFVYDHQYPELWKDGLWAALNLLEKREFEIEKYNLRDHPDGDHPQPSDYDFVLGWGGFNSPVERLIREWKCKKGLCIGGNAFPPDSQDSYDVLFYETNWYIPQIFNHKNIVHAFGVNISAYFEERRPSFLWDYTTVGAFADWKRLGLMKNKVGHKLAIGEIQKDNMQESGRIISDLLTDNIMISDMVPVEQLCKIYNASRRVYIPADINGGGERAVLEARACGRPVEVEFDNPKLRELQNSIIWSHYYYADQLQLGILST